MSDPHRITSLERLRQHMGEESPVTRQKLLDALDEQMLAFVARAPFALLATSNADGQLEVSPKGDGPGFIVAQDAQTLLIPDRKGNKLLFGLQNVLANPHVALIFLLPGTDETLRVSGVAELTTDPVVLARLTQRGAPALIATRVRVERCFFHCARAFLRASLWQPDSWGERLRVSFGRQLAPKLGGDAKLAETIDASIDKAMADL
jgi:PPOX class probable FMN-dependent enzyme